MAEAPHILDVGMGHTVQGFSAGEILCGLALRLVFIVAYLIKIKPFFADLMSLSRGAKLFAKGEEEHAFPYSFHEAYVE